MKLPNLLLSLTRNAQDVRQTIGTVHLMKDHGTDMTPVPQRCSDMNSEISWNVRFMLVTAKLKGIFF